MLIDVNFYLEWYMIIIIAFSMKPQSAGEVKSSDTTRKLFTVSSRCRHTVSYSCTYHGWCVCAWPEKRIAAKRFTTNRTYARVYERANCACLQNLHKNTNNNIDMNIKNKTNSKS